MNIEDELISRASSLTSDNLVLGVSSDMSKEERRSVLRNAREGVRATRKLVSNHRTGNDSNIPKVSVEDARKRLEARKKRLALKK